MANKRIIDLTAAGSFGLTDLLEIDTGALSLKVTGQQLYNLILATLNAANPLNLAGGNFEIYPDGSLSIGAGNAAIGGLDGSVSFAAGLYTVDASGNSSVQSEQIGSGTPIVKVLSTTAVLDFGSTAAGASTDLTIALAGAALGDIVVLGVPNASTLSNGVFTAWVSSANTVKVRFTNTNLAAALDPASGTFRVAVIQF